MLTEKPTGTITTQTRVGAHTHVHTHTLQPYSYQLLNPCNRPQQISNWEILHHQTPSASALECSELESFC